MGRRRHGMPYWDLVIWSLDRTNDPHFVASEILRLDSVMPEQACEDDEPLGRIWWDEEEE